MLVEMLLNIKLVVQASKNHYSTPFRLSILRIVLISFTIGDQ